MKLILLGAPGAGKGTQAEVLSETYAIPAISTGVIIRAAIKAGTEMGLAAQKLIDKGNLVPDEVVIALVQERLSEPDCKNGFILDGFPRTIEQAEALEKFGVEIDKVVSLEVDDETIVHRLFGRRQCESCGATYHLEHKPPKQPGVCDVCGSKLTVRHDDEPETVKARLAVYHQTTEPLKDFYRQRGKLVTVVGCEEIADTTKAVLDALS